MIDTGAGHVAGEDNIIKRNQVSICSVLEVNGRCQRVAGGKILKRAIRVNGNLRWKRIQRRYGGGVVNAAINNTVEWRRRTKLTCVGDTGIAQPQPQQNKQCMESPGAQHYCPASMAIISAAITWTRSIKHAGKSRPYVIIGFACIAIVCAAAITIHHSPVRQHKNGIIVRTPP